MKREIIGNRRTFIKGAALFGGLAVLFGIGGRPGVGKPKRAPAQAGTFRPGVSTHGTGEKILRDGTNLTADNTGSKG